MEYGTERQILSTAVEIEEDLGYRKKNKARGKNKQNLQGLQVMGTNVIGWRG